MKKKYRPPNRRTDRASALERGLSKKDDFALQPPERTLFRLRRLTTALTFGTFALCFVLLYFDHQAKSLKLPKVPVEDKDQIPPDLLRNDSYIFPIGSFVFEGTKSSPILLAVMKSFLVNTPASWPMQIMAPQVVLDVVKSDHTLKRYLHRLILTPYEDLVGRTVNGHVISGLLLTDQVWKQVRFDKILFFQHDTALCSTSPYSIMDFSHFNYIGAPWPAHHEATQIGNGGLSFRNRSLLLSTVSKGGGSGPEDVWHGTAAAKADGPFPTVPDAQRFSSEMILTDSAGAHNYWAHHKLEVIKQYTSVCPDVRISLPRDYI